MNAITGAHLARGAESFFVAMSVVVVANNVEQRKMM